MTAQIQLPDPVARRTLGDAVYDRLLQGILEGQLASGDELSEVTLAERYQVSRTPVREALARLVADGLVSNGPNRKATVLTFSRQLVVEIYEVRQFLEAGAAELAAQKFNPSELTRLQAAAENVQPGADHEWQRRALAFDLDFHRTIARQCGNRRLEVEIRRCTNFMPILQRLAGRRDDRLRMAFDDHLRILDALAAADAPRAVAKCASTWRRRWRSCSRTFTRTCDVLNLDPLRPAQPALLDERRTPPSEQGQCRRGERPRAWFGDRAAVDFDFVDCGADTERLPSIETR